MDLLGEKTTEKPKELGLSSSGDVGPSSGYIEKIKEKDVQLAQIAAKLKSREVELVALKSDSSLTSTQNAQLEANLAEANQKLEEMAKAALEAQKKIKELEAVVHSLERLKGVVTEKDTQLAALQEMVAPVDEANRNTRLQKKNEIIEQLNQTIQAKEQTILSLEAKLLTATQHQPTGSNKTLQLKVDALQKELESKTTTVQTLKEANKQLKSQFASAYEDGKIVANISDIDLRFKVEEAEHAKRVSQANLAKQEALNKQLVERCEKIERALVSAKKVEFIESRFTECLRLLEGQKKHNRGTYKQMCERVQRETEDKKVLQAKLQLLKSEYKKLTTPTDGPSTEEIKEEMEALKTELELKTAKLASVQAEFKALAQRYALLEAEFELI